jgi:hypothetical protein
MFAIHYAKRLAVTTMASGFIALACASHANACDADTHSVAMKAPASSNACDQARQFAWFKRQMELTDGDTDPTKRIETPAECKR